MARTNYKRSVQMFSGKRKGAMAVMFKKSGGDAWVKTFKSGSSAARAIKGITSKTSNKFVSSRPAKGFKYKDILKRMNG